MWCLVGAVTDFFKMRVTVTLTVKDLFDFVTNPLLEDDKVANPPTTPPL